MQEFTEVAKLVRAEIKKPSVEGRNPYTIVTILDKDYNVYNVMWRGAKEFPFSEVEFLSDYKFHYKKSVYNGKMDLALFDISNP